jgi:glycosyltransferase involved in cell wall biosynthesis
MRSLSLLVPVLNESLLIDEFVAKTTRDLGDGGLDWEVILIDDGSTDDSLAKMRRFASSEPRVKVISLGANRGPGANYLRGFAMASKEHVAWATVDAFYDTRLLPGLMEHLDHYSAISAYRTDLSAHPPRRRLQTIGNILIMRVLFPHLQFKAYHTLQIHRVDFIRAIQIEAVTPFMCSELLFKARALGLNIKEVGIEYLPRKKGRATGGSPKLIVRHVAEMLKFWTRWVLLRQPIVDPSISIPPRAARRTEIGAAFPASI